MTTPLPRHIYTFYCEMNVFKNIIVVIFNFFLITYIWILNNKKTLFLTRQSKNTLLYKCQACLALQLRFI